MTPLVDDANDPGRCALVFVDISRSVKVDVVESGGVVVGGFEFKNDNTAAAYRIFKTINLFHFFLKKISTRLCVCVCLCLLLALLLRKYR